MTCSNCGKELPQEARFCPNCGTPAEPAGRAGQTEAIPPIAEAPLVEEPCSGDSPVSRDEPGPVDSPVSQEEQEAGKKDCVNCGEDIPEDSVLCSYCGSWQENEEPENTEGIQKKTVDRRAFVAMAVVGVLLVLALVLIFSLVSSLADKPDTPEPLPESESVSGGSQPDQVYSGQYLVMPDYELMCPLDIVAGGECSYYVYLEYAGEPEDSYDSRQASISSPEEADIAIYVESGSSAEVYIPVGNYKVYYASGYDWQGPGAFFGEDTEYSKSSDVLTFYTDEESVYGYTLELWDAAEDIPDMETISPEDFPR